jgi:hypothetical protein
MNELIEKLREVLNKYPLAMQEAALEAELRRRQLCEDCGKPGAMPASTINDPPDMPMLCRPCWDKGFQEYLKREAEYEAAERLAEGDTEHD